MGGVLAGLNEDTTTSAVSRSAGEMANRIGSFAWSETAIGPASSWPTELKTLVDLILNSAQPMFVVWGAERIWLYNDAFLPILGRKHPSALGLPSQQVWAEAWDMIGPMFDRVFGGESVHMDDLAIRIDKHGAPEEAHFAFSYNPILEPTAGRVGGLFGVCTETTDRFLAEMRERLAAERQIHLFEQAPGFIIIMRGRNHVVEFVNDAHRHVFNSGDWLGKPIRDAFPSLEGQGFFEQLDNVLNGGKTFEAQGVPVRFRRSPESQEEARYLTFIYAPLYDGSSTVTGILCEGFDVTETYRARKRSAALAELGDVVRLIEDPDDLAYAAAEIIGRELEVSRAGYGTIDLAKETISIERDWNAPGIKSLAGVLHFRDYGTYIDDLKRGITVVFEDADKDPRTSHNAAALKAISAQSLINMPVTEKGGFVALLYLNHNRPRRWSEEEIEFVREMAERTRTAVERRRAQAELRQNESRLRFLDALGKETSKSTDADAVLEITTRMLGKRLGVAICAYADMDPDQDHFTIRGDWHRQGSSSIVGHYSLEAFGQLAVLRLHQGLPLIINDNRVELAPEEAATFQNIGIAATICMPLVKEGRLTALMAIHDNVPRVWTPNELALLTEVTERSWAHIERVRSDQGAAETAERLSLATRAAAIGTWDYDPVANHLRWDTRCRALFGIASSSDVSYEASFLAGLHPDDRDRADEAVRKALSPDSLHPFNIEYRTIGLEDGIERWVAASGHAIFEDEKAIRFIGTVIDVSDRKKAERHLKIVNDTGAAVAAEFNLDKIVQITTDAGVQLCGAQFGAFFYNVLDDQGGSYLLYALSGAPRSAFENYPMPRATAVFEPTFLGTAVVRSDDIMKDPRYGKNSPRKGMPEGHLPVRSYLAVPVVSNSGEVLGGLFFGHAEIGKFLPEHESALLGIAGHAATAIDNARLFQAAERELAERRRAEAALQTLNSTLEQRVIEEVAERSKAEEQLRQVQKMEAVGQLTGGIAHDFNNMLAVIIGGLNLLQRKLSKGETDVGRFVEGAMDGAHRAAALTQRLLAFSRQQPLKPEPINANRLMGGMTDLLMRTLGETIKVETAFGAGLWQVETDPGQLESALLNLSVNARDAMPKGGKLTFETSNAYVDERYARESAIAAGQFVLIAVTDTGTGMSAEVLAKAFDPFYTTKSVGKGTGLGLSQVYGFVRQSGGNVKIYSEPDVGTTVKIYLPRYYGSAEPDADQTQPRSIDGGLASEVVMVVEDEDRVRAVSAEALRELGYTVVEVSGPSEAIKMIEAGQELSLLFTDVVMPEMSGRQLVDLLRKKNPKLKVLYTTGYTRNAIVHNGILDPGTQLLPKPFSLEDLAEKVRTILDTPS
ncbi:GAF domain-containing protein [Mesorhizobium sp. M0518]|uniref:GAF domain-containing protein n=1 Tax=Mesorhizobium sp. M0518 TaxID=2956956 RepID=UPI0033355A09